MQLYYSLAAGLPIKAYINVGGGTISVGRKIGKRMFASGLNKKAPPGAHSVDAVMARFIVNGVPVIHMSGIKNLAHEFGFEVQPKRIPDVGVGDVFAAEAYNQWLIVSVLALILLSLYLLTRSDLIIRLATKKRDGASQYPEPMV